MKKIATAFFILLNIICFSQEKQTIKSGYITFNSNSTFEFKDLVIDGDTVTYTNTVSNAEMKFSLKGVKKIIDNYGKTIYESGSAAVTRKEDERVYAAKHKDSVKTFTMLSVESANKIYYNGKKLKPDQVRGVLHKNPDLLKDYNSGRTIMGIGDAFIGGGLGFALGTGVVNLTRSNKVAMSDEEAKDNSGSSTGIIVGLIVSAIGVPIRIIGGSQVKRAIEKYNEQGEAVASFQPELKVIAGGQGVGLQLQF